MEHRGYQSLVAWQKGMDFVVAVYEAARAWPNDETFGLVSQVRRAAVSVPSNISEGHGRSGPKEFLHHLSIAYGSLCEAETHLLIAQRLGYSNRETLEPTMRQAAEVGRLLNGLIRKLQRAPNAQ